MHTLAVTRPSTANPTDHSRLLLQQGPNKDGDNDQDGDVEDYHKDGDDDDQDVDVENHLEHGSDDQNVDVEDDHEAPPSWP